MHLLILMVLHNTKLFYTLNFNFTLLQTDIYEVVYVIEECILAMFFHKEPSLPLSRLVEFFEKF